jgi:hypothetical protein
MQNRKLAWFGVLMFILVLSRGHAALQPWFTGPIINNGARVLEKGHWNIFTDFAHTELPDVSISTLSPEITYGLTERIQLQAYPIYQYYRHKENQEYGVGDLPLILAYQIKVQDSASFWPSIELEMEETIPIGRYKNLSPRTPLVQGMGGGSYQFAVTLNTQYLSMPVPDHYLNTYFSLGYGYFQKTRITGFNTYGGGFGTNGELAGAPNINFDLAFEYQLTQQWVGVFEAYYKYNPTQLFSGQVGVLTDGLPATIFRAKINQISLAPAIEYNFNSHWGLIGGVWFSLNDPHPNRFTSFQLALNYGS